MAAHKGAYEDRAERRAKMVDMHKRGMSNGAIAMKFGVNKNTVRVTLIRVLGANYDASKHRKNKGKSV